MPKATTLFQKVNADGSITFDFTGHVHAQGLDLDAGTTSTPPTQDRVRWIRTSDGAAIAELFAFNTLGNPDTISELDITAESVTDPTSQAQIVLRSDARSGGASFVAARAQGFGGASAFPTIIDSNGQSDFLRLLNTAKLRLVTGTVVIQLVGGGGAFASSAAIPHGLGPGVPLAFANARNSIGLQIVAAKVQQDATNVTVIAYIPANTAPGATTNITCDWIAIG